MIKVLLVDDEDLVLNILRSRVPWEEYGMEIIGSEPDGKSALDYIQKNDVDIVFTDIKMPNMDGIVFIEKALLIKPNIEFIVLSSYSDFSLVKNAFRVGASDYILKVDIDSPNMMDLLHMLKTKKFLEPQLGNSFEAFIKDKLKEDKKQTREYKVSVAIISEVNALQEKLLKDTLKFYDNKYNTVWFFSSNSFVIVFIISENSSKSNMTLKNDIESILYNKIFNNQNNNCLISMSDVGSLSEIDKLYFNAKKQLNTSKFYFNNENKEINTLMIQKGMEVSTAEIKLQLWKSLKKLDFYNTRRIVTDLLNNIEYCKMEEKIAYSKITDIYTYFINHVFDFDLLPAVINNEAEYIKNKISGFDRFINLKQWILSQLDLIDEKCSYKKNENLMEMVKLFIEQNFENNLTLDDVARHFGISEGYLSRKFSNVIGVSFKEYINLLRNEKAKTLLAETDFKLTEICSEIGIANVEHFSRIFKKYVGVSPDNYRKKFAGLDSS